MEWKLGNMRDKSKGRLIRWRRFGRSLLSFRILLPSEWLLYFFSTFSFILPFFSFSLSRTRSVESFKIPPLPNVHDSLSCPNPKKSSLLLLFCSKFPFSLSMYQTTNTILENQFHLSPQTPKRSVRKRDRKSRLKVVSCNSQPLSKRMNETSQDDQDGG